MKPLVSVIIAVYNGEKYLSEAIESILAQTYQPIEILIVNDGSNDSTEQIAMKYVPKVNYFYKSNQGQPAAQNYGISMATGSYLSFLDADDIYLSDKIALQVEFLDAMPQLDMVFSHVEQFFSPDLEAEQRAKLTCPEGVVPGYLAAAGLFRKECFEKAGTFNEEQRIGPFIEWYMRATDKTLKNGLIPNMALRRRIHQNNMGINSGHSRQEYLQIVKEALKRRLVTGAKK